LWDFRNLKEFSHHRVIAGVLKGGIVIFLDEIEEGAEVRIAGMLGELFVTFRYPREKREDFIGGQGLEFSIIELLAEFRDGGVVGSEGIFFSNGVCDTRTNTGLPEELS
jgi:hypothetical protein